jgi:hypothetical protein
MTMPVITRMTPPSGLQSGPDGRQASLAWSVVAASELNAEQIVFSNYGVQRGSVYQSPEGEVIDPLLKCQRITTTPKGRGAPIGGVGLYIVTAEFARMSLGGGSRRKVAEPGGPAVWRIERSETTEPVDHDLTGLPIANSVEEPVDPPLTRITHPETLIAEWYETAVDEITLYGKYRPYTDHVNSVAFRTYPIGCLLFSGADPKPEDDGLFLVTAKWSYKPQKTLPGVGSYYKRVIGAGGIGVQALSAPIEGWADTNIHRGRRQLIDSMTTDVEKRYRAIVDKEGKVISDPALLSATGVLLASNQAPVALVTFHYPRIDFAQMSIP